ncbi:hypothetical protein BDQ12DRAFT_682150 [Crucibulum laeve]|uniref:FAD-binding domain-containing protein n=1 Tax=Crucibulum laeve TaxID=68775 RepID=A0A5C3M2L6_9AGAR|nr:hypothetical protein BDQ12DRAFT_682150 [Crucibulum laeve]
MLISLLSFSILHHPLSNLRLLILIRCSRTFTLKHNTVFTYSLRRLWPICGHAASLKIHDLPGTLLHTQPLPVTEFGAHAYNGRRGEMHTVLLEHALQLGVKVRWGVEVGSYWESGAATRNETRHEGQETDGPGSDAGIPSEAESGRAGVVLTSSERLEADVVVAADGVWSTARGYVLGYLDRPKSSGYAIYRAWFNAQDHGIDKDPLTDFMCKGEDVVYAWIGLDVHFITSCSQNGTAISCVLTHRDTSDIPESYSLPGSKPDVLRIVRDWDPRCAAVLSKAPHFVDWKLVYRDPLPTWISKGGRVLLVGDAAHPFLPTSIQGASQAIEDGVALAVTLQLAGKRKVPLAVKAWEHIRYERVRLAQLIGESTRDKWHTAAPRKQGADIYLPRPEWLFAFDVEKDAYEVYAQVSQKIEEQGYTMPVLPL